MNILDDIECERHLKENDPEPHEYKNVLVINNLLCAGTIPTLHGPNGCKVNIWPSFNILIAAFNKKLLECILQRDSGSALVCKDENRKWTQTGILSFSYKMKGGVICSNSIFTKVDRYLEFINEGGVFIYL